MSSKAIDANGNNVNNNTTYPTVTGTVTISRIQKSLYTKLATRYPNLTINATTKYHVVKFYNGSTLVSTQEVDDGGAATTPTTPTKPATIENVYSFSGWSQSYSNVTADMTINAQFTSSIQRYTVKFYDGDPETPGNTLATVSNVAYNADYTYPNTLPTKSGYVFCGWTDADDNVYNYVKQMPNASASIDSNGVPQTIELYPVWSAVQMPSASKDFSSLTPGEMLFCAIAIQNGSATNCTVTYYSETASYIIYDTVNNVSVTIAKGDTKKWTLYNGESLTQQVLDFNHDYSDLSEQNHLGITYAMKNCLTDGRAMNPTYKHAFNYKFGTDDPIVSDTDNHSSATDAALTHSYTPSAD